MLVRTREIQLLRLYLMNRLRQSVAAVLVLSALAQPVLAQVSVFPTAPRELETIRVRVPMNALGISGGSGDTYDPAGTTLTMTNNKIVVSLLMVGPDGFPRTPPLDWPLGQLPPGDYVVEVTKRSASHVNEGLVGTASFTVAPRPANGAMFNVTDLYWNSSQPGWGVSITRLVSGNLFIMWFVYGADNKPTWFYVSNGEWVNPRRYRGTVYRSAGPDFTQPYDPSKYQVTAVGNADIGFNEQDYDVVSLVYTVDGQTFVTSARRQRL